MKNSIFKIVFSIFFLVAIAIHVYYVIVPDTKPFWWHCIYYLTYGMCWWAILFNYKSRILLYSAMAIFPFATHFYYAYLHIHPPDFMLGVCILVCVILMLGFFYIRNSIYSK